MFLIAKLSKMPPAVANLSFSMLFFYVLLQMIFVYKYCFSVEELLLLITSIFEALYLF